MLRIFANYSDTAFSFNDLALFADRLNGWSNLHSNSPFYRPTKLLKHYIKYFLVMQVFFWSIFKLFLFPTLTVWIGRNRERRRKSGRCWSISIWVMAPSFCSTMMRNTPLRYWTRFSRESRKKGLRLCRFPSWFIGRISRWIMKDGRFWKVRRHKKRSAYNTFAGSGCM